MKKVREKVKEIRKLFDVPNEVKVILNNNATIYTDVKSAINNHITITLPEFYFEDCVIRGKCVF